VLQQRYLFTIAVAGHDDTYKGSFSSTRGESSLVFVSETTLKTSIEQKVWSLDDRPTVREIVEGLGGTDRVRFTETFAVGYLGHNARSAFQTSNIERIRKVIETG